MSKKKHRKNARYTAIIPATSPSFAVTIGERNCIGEFISNNDICIPMLQRDYAQGRVGKEYIRERFIEEIRKATVDGGAPLTLDFIYGNNDSKARNCFYPLDGQQRLTTVWLVYWYIALKSGKLTEEKDDLIHFSYETRKSSREFCKALCEKMSTYRESNGLVEYIKSQTWFYAVWKTDPTINAMLRTLGGTTSRDGIEPVFSSIATNKNKWERYLDNFKKNVYFYVLNIEGSMLPVETADQLYVKMNARGKALTDFENFKADFVSSLKAPEYAGQQIDGQELYIYIPSKMDNEWNDVFWKNVSAGTTDGKTDEVFFAFFNRFCLNQLFVKKDRGSSYVLQEKYIRFIDEIKDPENIEENAKSAIKNATPDEKEELLRYDYLSNDTDLSYEKFSYYEGILSSDNIVKLDNIFRGVMANISDIQSILTDISKVVSTREKSQYVFLPCYEYENGEKVSKKDKAGNKVGKIQVTTQKERIYFFAICKFFESNEAYDADLFKDWMRVVRNIVENSGIASVAAMIGCIRKIDELGTHSHSILKQLSSMTLTAIDQKTEMDSQIFEEVQKAIQINNVPLDKGKIEKAERYAFFCGRIRFLYTDTGGKENWSEFSNKYTTANTYFSGNVVSIDFVQKFDSMFLDFNDVKEKLVFHNKGWQNRGDSWIDLLCNEHEKTDHVLLGTNKKVATGEYKAFLDSDSFKEIVQKNGFLSRQKDLRIAYRSNTWALYKKSAQDGKMYFDNGTFKRGYLLSSLSSVSGFLLDKDQRIDSKENYYWGESIKFTYLTNYYVWTNDDEIFICDSKWKKKSKKVVNCSTQTPSNVIAGL